MIEDRLTTVAFTGHRTYRGQAAAALRAAIGELYARGFRTFLCGMAVGFDLAAAEAVLACRDCGCKPAVPVLACRDCGRESAAPVLACRDCGREPVPPEIPVSDANFVAPLGSVAVSQIASAVTSGSGLFPAAGSASLHPPQSPPSEKPMPGLRLVAVVPFQGQASRFSAADRERFHRVLAAADRSVTLSPSYHAGCYAVRNNYLVDHASLLVAWYDGSPGGTHYTVRRALRRGLEIVNLHPAAPALPVPASTLF